MSKFRFLLLCIPAACFGSFAKADPETTKTNAISIEWSVEDRFRLFNQADDAAKARIDNLLENLHAPAANPTSSTIIPASSSTIFSAHYDQILAALINDHGKSLRNSNWVWSDRTGVDGTRVYSQDYVRPRSYKIRVKLLNAASIQEQTCVWSVNGLNQTAAPQREECSKEIVLKVFRSGTDEKFGVQGVSVSVALESGLQLATTSIDFEDKLIVAMGDSFIAGEGNPDVPSVLLRTGPSQEFEKASWPATIPDGTIKHAEWWDKPCHRSLLSWPVLAGLYEAAQNKRKAITLVHVGCSGATIPDLTKGPQKDLPGGGKEDFHQIQQVRNLLDNKRAIDQIYLSIGGNDAKFGGVVQAMVLPPNDYLYGTLDLVAPRIVAKIGGAVLPYDRANWPLSNLKIPGRKSAQARLKDDLRGDFNELRSQLIGINDGLGSANPVHPPIVFQPEYPAILQVKAGDGDMYACRTILNTRDFLNYQGTYEERGLDLAFKIAMGADPSKTKSLAPYEFIDDRAGFEALNGIIPSPLRRRNADGWFFQFKYGPKGSTLPRQNGCGLRENANPADSEVCMAHWVWSRLNEVVRLQDSLVEKDAALSWTVFNGHVEKTRAHGWCGRDNKSPLKLPLASRDKETGVWQWNSEISPADFRPYRQDMPRWFRTANDSALTQYGGPGYFFQGSVHPTFNAHLAIAEAALEASRVIEVPSGVS
ncbi:SGNH/GDSL hydrolase family protein [Aquidulcibacter paucihalophilus]|uniref:hypothetical protein n=1 Tax=Aquidulcibacter paucihalophilus TaxID=1978549 RepID=UPI000A19396E|nr:hypothetical protein [Aquidulcibacter paucihalophilus]